MRDFRYDVLVIGAGPAGQQAALRKSASGKRVALVERGAIFTSGTFHQKGYSDKAIRKAFIGAVIAKQQPQDAAREYFTMGEIILQVSDTLQTESDALRRKLSHYKVALLEGTASFIDPYTIRLDYATGRCHAAVSAREILIATGTEATRAPHIPFDGRNILLSGEILAHETLPRSLGIVGAGRTGREYAILFAAMGVRVTLVDREPTLLSFSEQGYSTAFASAVRTHRISLCLGEEVVDVEPFVNEHGRRVLITTVARQIVTEKLLYAVERTGTTSHLNLDTIGITTTARGHVVVDENSRATLSHIRAVGSVAQRPITSETTVPENTIHVPSMAAPPTNW